MSAQLPALQVVLPLLMAPLALILRNPRLVWMLTLTVTWTTLAISLSLLMQVLDGGTITYRIGGWAAPWGIEYVLDKVGAFVLVIVSAIGSLVMTYARRSIEAEIPAERIYLFYTMFLLCLTGLLGITITGDVFNLFVFLEISSLSSYVMISLGRDRRALTAAYRYLIMGTIGATFYIIGVGLMYMMTGTLNMADLATLMPTIANTRVIQAALAFLTVGICLKLALFPLHLWLPNAYTYAPSVVTAFLAATATKVAVYILIRIIFTVFGAVNVFQVLDLQNILMALSIIAMFAASGIAIYQDNIKRLFAYSSIAQIGYIVLGLSFASEIGMAAGIIHLFNHAIMKCAIFMGLGCIALRVGGVSIRDMYGLGTRMPWTMAAIVIGGLSLIGIPMTVGFVSKWYLVRAALEAGMWPVAILIVLSSLLAIVYVWRIVEAAYLKEAPEDAAPVTEAPLSMLLPLWVMAGASIYFGIDATATLSIALDAAGSLLNGGLQ
ncbi:MAG: monovalent cation/H+ antiporter subunit D family protein [Rhodospirillaceae bacterium]|jgi:multicomponent Na+:H+ antiporter subunit D|nr:monovalent cation/H+ antiporter subunit D family protein [Rhodospirillaceae bacterium]MBT5244356.1 monovalent cation/H+ antiporter subunit D family protein [Rhodospirillaceae bacterium]MBT5563717.1 monovalent cation/H+ antiporter subunit D family protein [Rhodospirillaceae bacterium]MBT6241547.1 monovalent cation/H+ antiporter subunit D family protein [Rhodospirillaceae bacterium]MBT7137037.1 monovalent cation/H+ antiporter subunit D family protein [Rhodospirillaceae bacterium]